jgi:hypothetical protein
MRTTDAGGHLEQKLWTPLGTGARVLVVQLWTRS